MKVCVTKDSLIVIRDLLQSELASLKDNGSNEVYKLSLLDALSELPDDTELDS